MDDPYSPRRFQTRLTRKAADSKTGLDESLDNMGSMSSYFDIPMYRGTESATKTPMDRAWTHTSYVLGTSKSKATDQILLDQLSLTAEEVRDTKVFENRFLYFRGPLTNYNSIRETHRIQKETKREKAISTFEQVYRSPILIVSKLILAVRAFFKSTRRILIGTVLDFIFDLVFCISYLAEVQDNLGHITYLNTISMPQGFPQYLKVYRRDGLFTVIFVCAFWNLLSWLIRITYVC